MPARSCPAVLRKWAAHATASSARRSNSCTKRSLCEGPKNRPTALQIVAILSSSDTLRGAQESVRPQPGRRDASVTGYFLRIRAGGKGSSAANVRANGGAARSGAVWWLRAVPAVCGSKLALSVGLPALRLGLVLGAVPGAMVAAGVGQGVAAIEQRIDAVGDEAVHRSRNLGRRAHHHRIGRDDGIVGDETMAGDNAILTDDHTLHDRGTDADQAVVA